MKLQTDQTSPIHPTAHVVVRIKDGEVEGGVYMDKEDARIDMQEMSENETDEGEFHIFQAPVYLQDEDEDYVTEAVTAERQRISDAVGATQANWPIIGGKSYVMVDLVADAIYSPTPPTLRSVLKEVLESWEHTEVEADLDDIFKALEAKCVEVPK